MTDYKKPVVVGCDDVAEGVYAASGCYTVTTNIHQRPEFGRGDYLYLHRVRRLRLHFHIGIIQRITSEWVMLL